MVEHFATSPEHERPLASDDLPLRAVFYPLGFGVEIRTNAPEVLDAATEIWGHLRPRQISSTVQIRFAVTDSTAIECPAAPIFTGQRHLVSMIADVDNYAICDLRTAFGFARISRIALQDPLYFRYYFLESIALLLISSTHAPALHAACVSLHGQGFLLCGQSGAGKSTLAYACARAGFTYITDDASYLLRDADHPRIVGLSHKIRFRPHSRELFPELQQHEISPRMEGKPSIEVMTSELTGLTTAQEARIHYLILLDRQPGSVAELTPIPIAIALERFHENLYPVEEVRVEQIAALDQLKATEAYEFRYSTLDEAIHCLRSLVEDSGRAT